jgi:hypothetical protein
MECDGILSSLLMSSFVWCCSICVGGPLAESEPVPPIVKTTVRRRFARKMAENYSYARRSMSLKYVTWGFLESGRETASCSRRENHGCYPASRSHSHRKFLGKGKLYRRCHRGFLRSSSFFVLMTVNFDRLTAVYCVLFQINHYYYSTNCGAAVRFIVTTYSNITRRNYQHRSPSSRT